MAQYNFLVLANRLPVDVQLDDAGNQVLVESPGGLVTALRPVLAQQRGCWIGWPGVSEIDLDPQETTDGITLQPVRLSQQEYQDYYEGFCNATLWPLYHDLIVTPQYHRHWWESYKQVNERFAALAAELAAPGATVWVQDYQLQLVPGLLRKLRPDVRIGFFLHIPFPAPEIFLQLPWREEIIQGLAGADLLGFQILANAQNFRDLCAVAPHQNPDVTSIHYQATGQVTTNSVQAWLAGPDQRQIGIAAYPISIDLTPYAEPATPERIRAASGNPTTLLLGVDRLDYTKGILQRLTAFEELLEEGAFVPDETVFIQIATPSRERIDHYKQTKAAVEQAVSRINGRFGSMHHSLVQYHHRSVDRAQLRNLYAAADIMVVTPFKDGMNLVAKEYVAAHSDAKGALVLSEFAGAAQELHQAFLCNPFDIASIKDAIHRAAHTPAAQRAQRMRELYATVQAHPVQTWAQEFLRDLKVNA